MRKAGVKAVEVNAQTKLCLLLGNPVSHSFSPYIHNAGFEALKLNCLYLAAPVEAKYLRQAVDGLKALSVLGANVTSPYKEAVIPYLDYLSGEAKRIGTVNTIVNERGTLKGESTDGRGFLSAVKKNTPAYDLKQPAMIIGAGGAARAIAYTLAQIETGEIYIINRSLEKGQALADMIRSETPLKKCSAHSLASESIMPLLPRCGLYIYCLPVDSNEFLHVLDSKSSVLQNKLLFDLRYEPKKTTVMSTFKAAGGIAFNGIDMLFWQAVFSFELFTGKKAPLAEMQKALENKLKLEG